MTLHQCHNKSFSILKTCCWDSFVNFLKREREKIYIRLSILHESPVYMSGGKSVLFKDVIGKERMTTNMFFSWSNFGFFTLTWWWPLRVGTKHSAIKNRAIWLCEDTAMGSRPWVACMLPRPSLGVVKMSSPLWHLSVNTCSPKYLTPFHMGSIGAITKCLSPEVRPRI